MSRILTFCAAILMLALVATVPVLAEAPEAPAQIEQAQAEPAQVDLAPVEEPLMTPAEEPNVLDIPGFQESELVNAIRPCTEPERASISCPEECNCICRGSSAYCYC